MRKWLFLIIWMGVIFTLSSIPNAKIHEFDLLDFIMRKTAHITEYFILMVLAFNALYKIPSHTQGGIGLNKRKLRDILLSGSFSVCYAISDEFHQSFVPGRGPSAIDVGIDVIGIIIAIIYIWKYYQKTPKIIKKLLK